MACSQPSKDPAARSNAHARFARLSVPSRSTFARASTPVKSKCAATTSAVSPYTSHHAPSEVISFDLRSHRFRQAAHGLYTGLGFEASDTTVFRKIVRGPRGG